MGGGAKLFPKMHLKVESMMVQWIRRWTHNSTGCISIPGGLIFSRGLIATCPNPECFPVIGGLQDAAHFLLIAIANYK